MDEPDNHALPWSAAARTRILLAASLWTVVGAALLAVGAVWTFRAGTALTLLLVPIVVALGLAKAKWILIRTTRRIVSRVRQYGDEMWIGGFLPMWLWFAIASMIVVGNLLRRFVLPLDVVGLIYVAAGMALLLSCPILWAGWGMSRAATCDD